MQAPRIASLHVGRGERIRTSGLYVPNVALYQAKLHPDGRNKRPNLSADVPEADWLIVSNHRRSDWQGVAVPLQWPAGLPAALR